MSNATDPSPSSGATNRAQSSDPVVARREMIARWNTVASRTGYGLYAVSVVSFFVGLWWGLTQAMHLISGVSLVVGSVILAPSIVITYGIRAARREDEAGKNKEATTNDEASTA